MKMAVFLCPDLCKTPPFDVLGVQAAGSLPVLWTICPPQNRSARMFGSITTGIGTFLDPDVIIRVHSTVCLPSRGRWGSICRSFSSDLDRYDQVMIWNRPRISSQAGIAPAPHRRPASHRPAAPTRTAAPSHPDHASPVYFASSRCSSLSKRHAYQ